MILEPAIAEIINIGPDESRRLRDMPYEDFLDSSYWRCVRRLVMERARYRCEKCSATGIALEVHHKRYHHHGKEHRHLGDLACWCYDCHRRWHKNHMPTFARRWKQRQEAFRSEHKDGDRRPRGFGRRGRWIE